MNVFVGLQNEVFIWIGFFIFFKVSGRTAEFTYNCFNRKLLELSNDLSSLIINSFGNIIVWPSNHQNEADCLYTISDGVWQLFVLLCVIYMFIVGDNFLLQTDCHVCFCFWV
jgi:hypothetical protein